MAPRNWNRNRYLIDIGAVCIGPKCLPRLLSLTTFGNLYSCDDRRNRHADKAFDTTAAESNMGNLTNHPGLANEIQFSFPSFTIKKRCAIFESAVIYRVKMFWNFYIEL